MSNESQSEVKGQGNRPPLYKRQYIVDKPFQYRLIGTLMALWLANSIFFTIVLYFFYEGHLNQFYEVTPKPGMLPLVSLPALFAIAIGFIFTFGFIVLGIIAIYMSNQIAGPLFRTKKSLDRIGRGELGFQLQFRQGDFLRDIPNVFNAMMDGLRHQVETDLEELRAIEAAVDDSTRIKKLVHKQIERKEAQLGLSANGGDQRGSEPQPVSMAVH